LILDNGLDVRLRLGLKEYAISVRPSLFYGSSEKERVRLGATAITGSHISKRHDDNPRLWPGWKSIKSRCSSECDLSRSYSHP
jgi:hypothetical protein